MFFTQEDYKKIEDYLLHSGSRKDTDFPDCDDLQGDEIFATVQQDENRKITINKLLQSDLFKKSIQTYEQPLRDEISELARQIKALALGQPLTMNEFGDSDYMGVSQKALTEALNRVWNKINLITGESSTDINMIVTPTTFTGENCIIHIVAAGNDEYGPLEHIAFYINDSLVVEKDNVSFLEYETTINSTSTIKCVAKIMGVEYTKQQIITHQD